MGACASLPPKDEQNEMNDIVDDIEYILDDTEEEEGIETHAKLSNLLCMAI